MEILYTTDIPNDFTGVAHVNGEEHWFVNGVRHREDGPAIISSNGIKQWYKNGKYHRLDGPAYEGINGARQWFKEGRWHREDGPAIESPIRITAEFSVLQKTWYLEGKLLTSSYNPTSLIGNVILSKDNVHPIYPLVKIWKVLNKDKIFDLEVVPGMEEYIWI
jgi:hypothetical protein